MKPKMNRRLFGLLFIGFWLAVGCGRTKDFDLPGTNPGDANGFRLNPLWGAQAVRHVTPDPGVSCPKVKSADWTNSSAFPNCTSFPVSFDDSFFNHIGSCAHVNFTTITYSEASVRWREKAFWDGDYGLDLSRPDDALYDTVYGAVHVEFDSDETVDIWHDLNLGTWWRRFRDEGVEDSDEHAGKMIDGSEAIVIGLLNLDLGHTAKPELHPVYAMFVRLKESAIGRSSWAFFVRNWGNEGFCSDAEHPLDTPKNEIRVRIPGVAGLVSDNVSEGAQDEDDLAPMSATMQPSGDGVLLTFGLLPPEKESWFVGELTFVARPAKSLGDQAATAARPGGRIPAGVDDLEASLSPELRDLEARVRQLPAASRKALQQLLDAPTPRKKAYPAKVTVLFDAAQSGGTPPTGSTPAMRGQTSRMSAAREPHWHKKIEVIRRYLAEHPTG